MPKSKTKRHGPRRDKNPHNPRNWKLVCSACAMEWANDEKVDLIGGHFAEAHPDLDSAHLNTIWVGIGPTPKPRRR